MKKAWLAVFAGCPAIPGYAAATAGQSVPPSAARAAPGLDCVRDRLSTSELGGRIGGYIPFRLLMDVNARRFGSAQ